MLDNLKINPEFEKLIPPLSDDEFELLESNILSEGEVFTPIFTWDGYIIDGHHRYKILLNHTNIKYRVAEKTFTNKYEAMAWICCNQLGRRNLTPNNKKYLIGKRYDAEKMASDDFRGNQHTVLAVGQNSPLPKEKTHQTRKRIADETGTTQAYVKYADQFAKGVDAADEVVPGIKEEILSGQIKKPAYEVAAIAKAPPEERRALTENLRLSNIDVKPMKGAANAAKGVAANLRKKKPPASNDNALGTLKSTIDTMIDGCENLFSKFPGLLTDEQCYLKVSEIMQEAIKYISNLKGEHSIG